MNDATKPARRRAPVSLGLFLIGVLVAGLVLGMILRTDEQRRRRIEAEARSARQQVETLARVQAMDALIVPPLGFYSGSSSSGGNTVRLRDDPRAWSCSIIRVVEDQSAPAEERRRCAIHIEVLGAPSIGADPEIVVRDLGGIKNREAIAGLVEHYEKQGWRYHVATPENDSWIKSVAAATDQIPIVEAFLMGQARVATLGQVASGGSMDGTEGWMRSWTYHQIQEDTGPVVSTVRAEGGRDSTGALPLRITAEGGPEAEAVAEELRAECRRRGWKVEPASAEAEGG